MSGRLVKAVAIVVAMVLAVPGSDAVLRCFEGELDGAAASVGTQGLSARKVIGETGLGDVGEAAALVERLELSAAVDEAPVPKEFVEEVGFLPSSRDVRANADGSVVSYVVDGEAGETLSALDAHMQALGWTRVQLGGQMGSTYVKDSGACRWVLASCTQAGLATSVVLRCVIA